MDAADKLADREWRALERRLLENAAARDGSTAKGPPPPARPAEAGYDFSLWAIANYVPLVRPKEGQILRALILGPGHELAIHYQREHGSIPCVPGCRLCPWPARPKLYLPCAHRFEPPGLAPAPFLSPALLEVTGIGLTAISWKRGLNAMAFALKSKWTYREAGTVDAAVLPPAFVVIPYLEKIFRMRLHLAEGEVEEKPDVLQFRKKA